MCMLIWCSTIVFSGPVRLRPAIRCVQELGEVHVLVTKAEWDEKAGVNVVLKIPYLFEQTPPLNSHRPWIVATTSKHGTHTRVWMISDNSHHTSARTVCVVWVIPMADSRTERLSVLLTPLTISPVRTLSSCHWCLWAFQRNKHLPQIVAAQYEWQDK